MLDSDLISFAAVLVACLAAIYARHACDAARKANELTVYLQRRPLRLAVFQSMTQFAQYSSTYVTLNHLKVVNGTRDLVARIDTFEWEIEQHGPLAMPEVEAKVEEFVTSKLPAVTDDLKKLEGLKDNPVVLALLNAVHVPVEALGGPVAVLNELEKLYKPDTAIAAPSEPAAPAAPAEPVPAAG